MASIFRSAILVDPEDQWLVDKYTWHTHPRGYPCAVIQGKKVALHKVLFPAWKLVDHINRKPLDNRRSNLREASPTENCRNRSKLKSATTSKHKGVLKCTGKMEGYYKAYYTKNYIQYFLGYHVSEAKAALAYNEAAVKYFGEFALLNLIEGDSNV